MGGLDVGPWTFGAGCAMCPKMSNDLIIHDLAPMGDGIHRSEQGAVYVERTLPGDVVEAKIRKAAGGILRGDTSRLVTLSPHRVEAPCRHYDVCGGCELQHARDDFYRNWKTDIVRIALERQDLTPELWQPPIFLPAGGRRRATFAALKKKDGVQLGFFQRRTHQVTNVPGCLILDGAVMELRSKLVSQLRPILQDGKPADIFIQVVDGQCEVVITGPVGQKGRPDLQVYETAAALAHTAKVARIAWRLREHTEPEILLELSPLRAKFGALDVMLPLLAFLQPTKAGEDALVSAVMEKLPQKGRFADLFSGSGTFAGAMLTRGPVDAYEISATTVRALDKSRGAEPLTTQQRDLFKNPIEASEAGRYDAVVFDPPRAGALEQAKMLAEAKTPLIVGVSCNPATFARDARILVDGGYKLRSVQIVDQFAWSHHVELVASFTKNG